MMMKTWLTTLSVATALIYSPVQAAGDAKAGEQKANTVCMACHGPMGNSVVPNWPKLAGQHPEYIYKQLKNFKDGAREDPQMTPMALPLTDEDMLNVAAYYASQTQSGGAADPALADLGERIYRGGNPKSGVPACTGCHGPAGMGQGLSKFPRVAGQHADYTKLTLTKFRDGVRANDPNGMMGGVAARMSDQEIAAVSQYLQGLSQ